MKKAPFKLSLIFAGVLAASSAAAGPYDSWHSAVSDDDQLSISDSFNRESSVSSRYSEDNDSWRTDTRSEDNDYTSSVSEDNDVSSSVTEDNDYTSTVSQRHSEDNDFWSRHSEDNDVTSSYSEDNDVTTTEDNDVTTDLDFQIATPTMTSHKFQDQDAGHQADTQVYGAASGHSVGVEGGTNLVSAGNEETVYYGPALVNTNTNINPVNNAFVQGSNSAPIYQANTVAGGDMGDRGIFGSPIGNTSAQVGGSVGNQSGAAVDQSGDAANSIADPMTSVIGR